MRAVTLLFVCLTACHQGDPDQGLQTLVTQCISANDTKTINCMIDAKTADEVEACAPRANTN